MQSSAEVHEQSNSLEIGGEDFALLGDAAGFADPATGEGIPNALHSGEMAAEAYAADGSFLAYPRIAIGALEPEFRIARSSAASGGTACGSDATVVMAGERRSRPVHALDPVPGSG